MPRLTCAQPCRFILGPLPVRSVEPCGCQASPPALCSLTHPATQPPFSPAPFKHFILSFDEFFHHSRGQLLPHPSPASTGHLIRHIFGVFLAAEPFPGFSHAGVRGFSLGGWQRLPPHWNYNYLSCPSNSSASTARLAGAPTPIGSGEVRRNLTVRLDISQHSDVAPHPVTAKVPLPTKAPYERK